MAQLSRAEIDNLPDSAFAYIENGGTKDKGGKTTPRSKRHFPIHNAEHVRNALSRIAQGAEFGQQALPKVRAAAKKFGVDTEKAGTSSYERKAFQFKVTSPPDAEGRFTGYAAVFGNVDRGNDVIEPGAVTKTLQENSSVPIFFGHNYGTVPIGIGNLSRDTKGVKIDGQLFVDTSDAAREVYGAMKAGAIKGLSIGYQTLSRVFKAGIRHLQEIAIGEVSLAPAGFQMNPLALVQSVKDLSGYQDTDGVSALLCAIRSVADFMVGEVAEGDTDDASRSLAILNSLAKLLTSELGELAAGADGDNGEDDLDAAYGYQEGMSASLDYAIKSLMALQSSSHSGVMEDSDDPEAADALRALLADMKVNHG